MRSMMNACAAALYCAVALARPPTKHQSADPNPAAVLAAMNAADAYFAANNDLGDCNWQRATYFVGAMAHYKATCFSGGCNATLLDRIEAWAQQWQYRCAPNDTAPYWQACGQTYAELYALNPSPEKLALLPVLEQHVVASNRTDITDWVDGLFMTVPTLAWYANVTAAQDGMFLAKAVSLFLYTAYLDDTPPYGTTPPPRDVPAGAHVLTVGNVSGPSRGILDRNLNLYYRDMGWVNITEPNGLPVFWARGNGWAIGTLCRTLAALPSNSPYVPLFAARLSAMARALAPLQGSDGLWRASLLDSDLVPNPETTGTAMFVYGLAFGVNAGLLDRATYAPVIAAGWSGLSNVSLQPSGLVGWCQQPGNQPRPTTVNSTVDYCVGMFLMAGAEVARMYS